MYIVKKFGNKIACFETHFRNAKKLLRKCFTAYMYVIKANIISMRVHQPYCNIG